MSNDPSSAAPRLWAVIPAAGSGSRMAMASPKQYLKLCGKTVLQHTLERIAGHHAVAATVVVISAGDRDWPLVADQVQHYPLLVAEGGAERCHSVLNGLRALSGRAAPDDWVLVHDAARPCVRREDVDKLVAQIAGHAQGGLLGIPVADTMKRSDTAGNILETVSREGLWRALTPQMFPYQNLLEALQAALSRGTMVTDEAAAMEMAGYRPRMVEGHADNIKITRPQDLALAEMYLRQQEQA